MMYIRLGCCRCHCSPSGTRLLVNDQKDVIKAYEGPLWDEYLSLKHPHRQFQHLTGIEVLRVTCLSVSVSVVADKNGFCRRLGILWMI